MSGASNQDIEGRQGNRCLGVKVAFDDNASLNGGQFQRQLQIGGFVVAYLDDIRALVVQGGAEPGVEISTV